MKERKEERKGKKRRYKKEKKEFFENDIKIGNDDAMYA